MTDGTPFESALEVDLYAWAIDHLPSAVPLIEAAWSDPARCRIYLGRVLRRVIEATPAYVYALAEDRPDQLLALAPHVGDVQMPWGPMPGPLGWPAWVRGLRDATAFAGSPFDAAAWRVMVATDATAAALNVPAVAKARQPSDAPLVGIERQPRHALV